MPHKCEVGDCGITCEFGCSCIQASAGCECSCTNQTLEMAKFFAGRVADADEVVSFTATEMSLITLAEWFDSVFPNQILIPASKAQTPVTTDGVVEDIKLGDLIKRLGLVTTQERLEGRDFSDYESNS